MTEAELLELERRGWDSLCDGTGAEFYGELLTEDGVMLLVGGLVLDRDGVVASLSDAPTWDRYGISEPRVIPLGPDAAALVYRGTATRAADGAAATLDAVMTSVYRRADGRVRLAVYQQTLVG